MNLFFDIGSGEAPQIYLPKPTLERVVALDASKEMLDFNPSAYKIQADAQTSLPFVDNSFGFVTMFFINRYLPNPEAVMTEVLRVLKPGGLLFVIDFNTNRHPLEECQFDPKGLAKSVLKGKCRNINIETLNFGTIVNRQRVNRASVLSAKKALSKSSDK